MRSLWYLFCVCAEFGVHGVTFCEELSRGTYLFFCGWALERCFLENKSGTSLMLGPLINIIARLFLDLAFVACGLAGLEPVAYFFFLLEERI